jgi:DNA polymerase elongation subunit (family B)
LAAGEQSGRETLENTIRMVEAHPEWRARIVYGDTDSLFVLVPGRSRREAFRIGAEIAAAATAANPPPVTLKMEKVSSRLKFVCTTFAACLLAGATQQCWPVVICCTW